MKTKNGKVLDYFAIFVFQYLGFDSDPAKLLDVIFSPRYSRMPRLRKTDWANAYQAEAEIRRIMSILTIICDFERISCSLFISILLN